MTGGLADVMGALPISLQARGDDVAVVLPLYRSARQHLKEADQVYDRLPVWLGTTSHDASVKMVAREGVRFYFVEFPPLFDREGLYGESGADYPDNHIRFGVFCQAALEIARRLFRPHVIHCHDWQAALVPTLLHDRYASDPTFYGMKVLLTIHNLGYQGLFPRTVLSDLQLSSALFIPDALEFHGRVNLLKGGIVFSDAISTVSKAYAKEIQTPELGFGLDGLLRSRSRVLFGIVNGVDYSRWDPSVDEHLPANYDLTDLSGKQLCKSALLRDCGLPHDLEAPLIGRVSRLVPQKGCDLIDEIFSDLLKEDFFFVLLGSGEPHYEGMFRSVAAAHPDRVFVKIGYDDALSHRIEAGADIFLMPSHYEPCGLNQIYSLRYGTVPVVHATGGLDDTIDEETGFKFRIYTGAALLEAVRAALSAYQDRPGWQQMMCRGMQKDFSWDVSAAEYSALYRWLLG